LVAAVSVAAPVMTGLVVGGIIGAGGGKQRASEKREDEKFHG
jgi:hypothetical protein